jgi:phosphohistidine phosphatase
VKNLTLFRHAKSSWDERGLADRKRPLSKRGLRDAPIMAARMFERGLEPDLLLSSPATRARQTAEFLAKAFSSAAPNLRLEPSLYLASPGELLAAVSAVSDDIDSMILIGHNPGLTRLANLLLSDLALANLPTAGAVSIDCETDSWHGIESGAFSLRFYDFPKNRNVSL